MEYDIRLFTGMLREYMYKLFPNLKDRGRNPSGSYKHKYDNKEIRDVAFMNLPVEFGEGIISFNIGDPNSESKYPYYHILQQAPVIRKRNKGTTKSKGSEMMYKNPAERDFERVIWNGKTFTKEYTKNVRGERNKVRDRATQRIYAYGQYGYRNKNAGSYLNIHYQYIDQMLDIIAPELAAQFNMKLARKQDSGLEEDFAFQEGVDVESVLETFASFE